MNTKVNFRGRSGKAWEFTSISPDAPWARSSGVAIFAAREGFAWRVIRVIELSGRPHDLQPIWAFADAERYGAASIFLTHEFDAAARREIVSDISEGFSPVCHSIIDDRIAA